MGYIVVVAVTTYEKECSRCGTRFETGSAMQEHCHDCEVKALFAGDRDE